MPRLAMKGVSVDCHDRWLRLRVAVTAKAKSGSDGFSTLATLNSGNKVADTDYIMTGTTIPTSCDFRLQFDGEATGYMQHEMKAASFCINPLSDPAVRLDSGADLRSILDNLRDNGINDSNDGDGSECDSEDDEGGDTEVI
eukprot:scaffold5646_cov36-Cyclotella_meneghiniana.AAC.6